MCERIGSLVEYFKLVITDGSLLSPVLDNTIKTLARYILERSCTRRVIDIEPFRDIDKLNGAMEGIVAERKSRLRRYVSAKQHRKKLEGIARKLDEARGNYTVSHITIYSGTAIDDGLC